ncbi:glutathione transporter ATP-binding protein [compost metagenome]
MADRVLVMQEGRIVEEGGQDIWKRASHAYTRTLIGAVPVPRFAHDAAYEAPHEAIPYIDPAWHALPVAVLLSRFAV